MFNSVILLFRWTSVIDDDSRVNATLLMLNLHFTPQTFSFIALLNEFRLVALASYG